MGCQRTHEAWHHGLADRLRGVWQRNDLDIFKKRLKALETSGAGGGGTDQSAGPKVGKSQTGKGGVW